MTASWGWSRAWWTGLAGEGERAVSLVGRAGGGILITQLVALQGRDQPWEEQQEQSHVARLKFPDDLSFGRHHLARTDIVVCFLASTWLQKHTGQTAQNLLRPTEPEEIGEADGWDGNENERTI